MSRSTKKTPIIGNCADSEKYDKRIANRRLRRAAKTWIQNPKNNIPLLREISNVWCMDKDGKHWIGSLPRGERFKWMRK